MARKVKVGDRVAVQFGMVAETGVVTSVEDDDYVGIFIEDAGGFGEDVTVTREIGEITVTRPKTIHFRTWRGRETACGLSASTRPGSAYFVTEKLVVDDWNRVTCIRCLTARTEPS